MKRQRTEKRQRFFRKLWQLFCLVSLMAAALFAMTLLGMWLEWYGKMENPIIWLPLVVYITGIAWFFIATYKTVCKLLGRD